MNVFFRYGCLTILFLTGIFPLSAQELNASVKVNSSHIQGTNRQVFVSLEEALRIFINGRKWTNTDHPANERVDCAFTVVITETVTAGSFRGELLVQSRRPVRNTTHTTPMLNVRDRQFDFDYAEYLPLEFDPNYIQGNLTATIAFYVYLILGLHFDSTSSFGGTPCFRQMESIVANVQPYGWSGWEPFGSNRNRFAVSAAFNDGSQEAYRQMWYDYHRLGLDEMGDNNEQGREKVASAIPVVSSLHAQRPTSVLLTLFGDAKLEELTNVLSQASGREKQQAYNALREIYPAKTAELFR
jgi:hypothetical protein